MISREWFITVFARKRKFFLLEKALIYAKIFHQGKKRLDGQDYISHPIKVCLILIACNIKDEVILAAALLHDVLEENEEVTYRDLKALFGKLIANTVFLLSKNKRVSYPKYFGPISENFRAIIIKAADRLCNVGDMVDSYSPEKMKKYIWETEKHIYPLIEKAWWKNRKYRYLMPLFRDYIEVALKADKKVLELYEKNFILKLENLKLKNKIKKLAKACR